MRIKNPSDLPERYRKQIAEQQGPPKTKLEYPFEFTLDFELSSVNAFTGDKSRFKRMNERVKIMSMLHWSGLGRIETPQHRQRVTYTRVIPKGGRRWDSANFTGGSHKQLQDAMKHAGFFVDDSDKWIDVVTLQDDTERPDKGYVKIKVEII